VGAVSAPAPAVTGQTVVWTLGTQGVGAVTLVYQAKVGDLEAAGTVLTNRAAARSMNGAEADAHADVTVTGDYTVMIDVYNTAGEVVKQIAVQKYSQSVDNVTLEANSVISQAGQVIQLVWDGTVIGSWDGTNGAGAPVANGQYYIKIDNTDAYGTETSVTTAVTVNRPMSELKITVYNQAGEVVRTLASAWGGPTDEVTGATLSETTIDPGYLGGSSTTPKTTAVVLSTGTVAVWDGRNDAGVVVTDGTYYVSIDADDGKGNQTTVVRTVNVLSSGSGDPGLKVAPNVLTAMDPTAHVTVGVPNATLKGTLYTVAGEKVGTVWGTAGSSAINWDLSGKASGMYLLVVEVTDGSGAYQGRYLTKLILQK